MINRTPELDRDLEKIAPGTWFQTRANCYVRTLDGESLDHSLIWDADLLMIDPGWTRLWQAVMNRDGQVFLISIIHISHHKGRAQPDSSTPRVDCH